MSLVMGALLASGCPGGGSESKPTAAQPDAGRTGLDPDAALVSPDGPPASIPDLALPVDQARPDGSLEPAVEAGCPDVIFGTDAPTTDSPSTTFDCRPLSMVWEIDGQELSRQGYVFAGDACAGYRCLVGNTISPACYNDRECPTACKGLCLSVPSMAMQCPVRFDGGAAIDRPKPVGDAAGGVEDSIVCGEVDMVWPGDNGSRSRRDPNCAFHVTSPSGFCYDFSDDTCDGYRCLFSKDLSPACLTLSSCSATCDGHCVLIPTMRQRCRRLDGGTVVDGG
jgi:hypothetical protein